MYSNMASRQWFIGVKSNTDKQKNRLRHPYTDFKSRRAKSAPAVSRTILRKLRAAVGGSGASSRRTLQSLDYSLAPLVCRKNSAF